MRKPIVGVMGTGDRASELEIQQAYELGQHIAQQGWVLLTGGRAVGVMDAACQGAKQANGLTLGILPGATHQGVSTAVDIPILTDLGNARNNINVLTSDVVIACGMGTGTLSEIALALKAKKFVILLHSDASALAFLHQLAPQQVSIASDPKAAIALTQERLHMLGLISSTQN